MNRLPIALPTPREPLQHEPHVVRFVDAHFDEVIAGAERAEMRVVVRLFQLRILVDDPLEARLQRLPRFGHGGRRAVAPRARIAAARRAAVRHRAFDRAAQPRERIRQVGCRQRRARGHHPAADVDADRGRNDRALGRNHAADRRLAEVDVRHHRDVAEDERHLRGVAQLGARLVFNGHALRPHLHRLAVRQFHYLVIHFTHVHHLATLFEARRACAVPDHALRAFDADESVQHLRDRRTPRCGRSVPRRARAFPAP